MTKRILDKVNKYYTEKISEFGATSKGVDWNGQESHYLRFNQLAKVIRTNSNFSILDYGCGYGSFIDFLNKNDFSQFEYIGFDISNDMLSNAKEQFKSEHLKFVNDIDSIAKIDYTIASGLFNVKLDESESKWESYILKSLDIINDKSVKGFSFNVLTSYSDTEYKKDYLYYANPMILFDYCKKNYAKNIVLLHDYNLYEFTIIVRKE